ncbi:MAG: OmpA family protein [Deltaproteobacteria bacterium]|nr:OmpA family protein [Deltaproteobacteria bacterium]
MKATDRPRPSPTVRVALLATLCAVLPALGSADDDGPARNAQSRSAGDREQAQGEQQITVTPPRLNLRRQDVDLENCRVHFSISRRAQRVLVELRGLRGDLMYSQERALDDLRPGARIDVTWPAQTEQIGRIEVTTWDDQEASATFRISPFKVEIPHTDVVFETNKWEIRETESPKLDEAWGLIEQAMNDYGNLLEAALYVGGFTDTVGQPRDNQTLSEHRARAIAEYFKAKGMTFPIYARGFGEKCLAVDTPDNTDMEANRRSMYVLAAEPPELCPGAGNGGWTRIR